MEDAVAAGRSASGPDKFTALRFKTISLGDNFPPGLSGGLAVFWCNVTTVVETGDHFTFIGAILRFGRQYARLGATLSAVSPEG
jgi:flavin reductase (DIM6/NTAB) family NADH-FMN oxidoreductase RutF